LMQPDPGVAEVACVAGGQLGANGPWGNPGKSSVTQNRRNVLAFASAAEKTSSSLAAIMIGVHSILRFTLFFSN